MHAVSTSQIADVLHFNDNFEYKIQFSPHQIFPTLLSFPESSFDLCNPEAYSELCKKSKMDVFCEKFNGCRHHKKLYLRCFTGFQAIAEQQTQVLISKYGCFKDTDTQTIRYFFIDIHLHPRFNFLILHIQQNHLWTFHYCGCVYYPEAFIEPSRISTMELFWANS